MSFCQRILNNQVFAKHSSVQMTNLSMHILEIQGVARSDEMINQSMNIFRLFLLEIQFELKLLIELMCFCYLD